MNLHSLPIAVVTLKFFLIGPPVGAVLLTFIPAIAGLANGSTGGLSFLLISIPFSYILGGIPAAIAGFSYGLASQLTSKKIAIVICVLAGALASAFYPISDFPKLNVGLLVLGFLSSLITAKISSKSFL